MEPLHLDWDENKRIANLAKHGLDFARLFEFDWASAKLVPDGRRDYGEVRLRAYGQLQGLTCVVIFTPRGHVYRIISARRASRRERAEYEQAAVQRHRRG